jgi:hypothetical protein
VEPADDAIDNNNNNASWSTVIEELRLCFLQLEGLPSMPVEDDDWYIAYNDYENIIKTATTAKARTHGGTLRHNNRFSRIDQKYIVFSVATASSFSSSPHHPSSSPSYVSGCKKKDSATSRTGVQITIPPMWCHESKSQVTHPGWTKLNNLQRHIRVRGNRNLNADCPCHSEKPAPVAL